MSTAATPRKARLAPTPAPAPASLPMYRFSVEQYHRMIETGILKSGDRAELLEGWIVAEMTHYPPHAAAVRRINLWLARILPPDRWVLSTQLPITTRESEPEPDFAVLRGPAQSYDVRHPGPADVGLLIEVADTSLDTDQGPKLRIFAGSRIPCYWIVNVRGKRIEVYTDPRGGRSPAYRHRQDYTATDAIPLIIGGEDFGAIAVSDLLP